MFLGDFRLETEYDFHTLVCVYSGSLHNTPILFQTVLSSDKERAAVLGTESKKISVNIADCKKERLGTLLLTKKSKLVALQCCYCWKLLLVSILSRIGARVVTFVPFLIE